MKTPKDVTPRELPILGSGLRFGKDPLKFFQELHQEFGDVARYHLLGKEFVTIFTPALVEQVMIKNANNYIKSVFLRDDWSPFLGKGVLSSDGDSWKNSRRILQPFMSKDKIGHYQEVFELEAERYATRIQDGETVNVSDGMMELMFLSLVKILFHSELDPKKSERFRELFDEVIRYFLFTLGPGMLLKAFPTPQKKRFMKAIAELDHFVEEMLSMEMDPEDVNMFCALKKAKDENGQPLSNQLIRDNVLTFFMAGHETSSLTISYTLFLLATHPHVMKEVQQELDEVLQGKAPGMADLEKLKKTRNAINESMRIYPASALTGREAIGEDNLAGLPIKKGTNLFIPIYVIHRDPKFFPDPDSFRPERWEGYDFTQHRGEFIPFGIGPRICIGASFAMMEITTIVAILLQKFDLKLKSSPELKLETSITMRPKEDILLEFRRR